MRSTLLVVSFLIFFSSFAGAQKKIFDAIEKGDQQAVQKYIQKGSDLNVMALKPGILKSTGQKTQHELSLLDWAAIKNQEAIVDLLLQHKAGFKDPKTMISRAFSISISAGNLNLTKKLHAAGADINYRCVPCHSQTAIQTAVFYKFSDIFNYLYNQGADLSLYNERGQTLLHTAAFVADKSVVELLLNKGFDANAKDSLDYTPLYFAAEAGDSAVFFMLLKHSGDILIRTKDKSDLVFAAAAGGNMSILRYLEGENLQLDRLNEDRDSPLLFAIMDGRTEAALWLLERGVSPDDMNNYSETPLFWAIANNNAAVIQKLVNNEYVSLLQLDYVKYARQAKCSPEVLALLEKERKKQEDELKKYLEEKKKKEQGGK